MSRILLIVAALALISGACGAEQRFKDVPEEHWAAPAVNALADAGILKGYPDGTFKGEKTITRFELAAALSSMIQFIQQSSKPLTPDSKPAPQGLKPPTQPAPPQQNWSDASVSFLKSGGYLPSDSPILKDGDKPVTPEELANALASVATRLIERNVKEPAPTQ